MTTFSPTAPAIAAAGGATLPAGERCAQDRYGSLLWLLAREKQIPCVLARAEAYAREALAWLITDGIASRVDVAASFPALGWLALEVAIHRPTAPPARYRFDLAWAAQASRSGQGPTRNRWRWFRPTLEECIEAVRGDFAARLPGADTRTRRSPIDVFARMVGYVHHTIYGWLDWLAKQLLPDSSEVEWLARHASIWGVTRKPAAYATGTVTVSGTAGTLVPEATVWQRADGVQYAQDAAAAIPGSRPGDGTATVVVAALVAGDAGNADAGVPVSLVSPIAGVVSDAVVAEDGIAAGADEEPMRPCARASSPASRHPRTAAMPRITSNGRWPSPASPAPGCFRSPTAPAPSSSAS